MGPRGEGLCPRCRGGAGRFHDGTPTFISSRLDTHPTSQDGSLQWPCCKQSRAHTRGDLTEGYRGIGQACPPLGRLVAPAARLRGRVAKITAKVWRPTLPPSSFMVQSSVQSGPSDATSSYIAQGIGGHSQRNALSIVLAPLLPMPAFCRCGRTSLRSPTTASR